ncbi:hypothetical protein HYQ19_gp068 [Arthrobacter phage DrYang]|uniref:Uncharacterized protein n=1 Tax=Arthrobacter phage DrYang TaxID=2686080 RepID=A0A6B9JKP4_9CAUD|nr:hypothetical protein HYQ19_gp068 [Arthrobacter phage DrYang]QGZ17167.1 hypothetical protein SEA_DRYANG_68 [Arthrobacter phage DrYang]
MTIAPITQAEIDNVVVTREGSTLRATTDLLKVTASMEDSPATIRTRATLLLALANYIDNPPLPPFEFPKRHAAVIVANTPMIDGRTYPARFTRIEDSGWFSAAYGWKTEDALRRDFENLRVVFEGVEPDPTIEGEPPAPGEQAVTE